ncbi:MAG TPA: helix-turn-helix domain-containing protein [Lysobacter sp.]|nr:helix-turn-helix domain-containing protein [Lysobacter sp.]
MGELTLSARLADHTRSLILASAVELLEAEPVSGLTVRAVAARAGISERTVFRYFATRDDFLEAVASEVARRLELPAPPATVDELPDFADRLYRRFEAKAALTRAALHTEIFSRMRDTQARERWASVQRLVDAYAPRRSAEARAIAAANIRYFLSATTWHYYRTHFGFELERAIACAHVAVAQALEALKPRAR